MEQLSFPFMKDDVWWICINCKKLVNEPHYEVGLGFLLERCRKALGEDNGSQTN